MIGPLWANSPCNQCLAPFLERCTCFTNVCVRCMNKWWQVKNLLIRSRGPSLFVNPNKKGILGAWKSCVQARSFVSEKTHLNDNDCGKRDWLLCRRVGGRLFCLFVCWVLSGLLTKQRCWNPGPITYRDLSLFRSAGVSSPHFTKIKSSVAHGSKLGKVMRLVLHHCRFMPLSVDLQTTHPGASRAICSPLWRCDVIISRSTLLLCGQSGLNPSLLGQWVQSAKLYCVPCLQWNVGGQVLLV